MQSWRGSSGLDNPLATEPGCAPGRRTCDGSPSSWGPSDPDLELGACGLLWTCALAMLGKHRRKPVDRRKPEVTFARRGATRGG